MCRGCDNFDVDRWRCFRSKRGRVCKKRNSRSCLDLSRRSKAHRLDRRSVCALCDTPFCRRKARVVVRRILVLGLPVYGARNAGKTEWEWYLGRLFEKGKSLDALNSCIERQKAELGAPSFKHKVVLSIPTPITGHTDWGELDGRKLDFNNYADQILAVSWFIDQLVGRFQSEGYENLELAGLYWVDEDICHTKELVKYVSPLVHEKGLDFVWIPYFKARGYDRWRELGFDIAYHQPNHFFDKSIPDSRLDEACDIAFELGMAMEFECDSKALFGIEDSSYERMKAYIEAFRRKHVFDDSAIAYYTGSKGFIDMAENPCAENQSIMDELARIIMERRHNKNLLP